jgi:DNA polymerase-1
MIPLALDTETRLITPEVQAPDLACVAVQCRGAGRLFHHSEAFEIVWEILHDPEILIVGHSIAFDMVVLAANFPALLPAIFAAYNANRITDTEIREKLLDVARGRYRGFDVIHGVTVKLNYGLGPMSSRMLDRTLDKDTWRLRYGELIPYPLAQWPEGARVYPLEDVRATDDIFQIQESPELAPFLVDQFRQARAAFWIRLMSCWGIHTDAQGVWELAEKTQQEYESIAIDLRAVGLLKEDRRVKRRSGLIEIEKGSRNTKIAGQRLIAAYMAQGKDYPRTESGKAPCLDERACIDSGDETLIKYANFASLGAVLAKDIPLLERGLIHAIHSRFESLLETGRTSSSDPNIQNPKRKGGIRECFIPRPGTVFVACDYSGAELCTLGQACLTLLGRSALADAMNAGRDPHLMIASQIVRAPYEVLKRILESQTSELWEGRAFTYEQVDDLRQTGKVANFGFPGGLGAAALVAFALGNYGVRLTIEQARDLKRTWLATWPEMADYFRFIDWQVKQPFPIIEQLFSGRFRGGVTYTEACNTLFQGLAADMAKDAGWLICQGCYLDQSSPLFGCRIVNFVHDEFIIEAPEHRAHEAGAELSRLMILASRNWLPQVKIVAKPVAMRRWSKKAKQVWEGDRLVPWG